LVKRARETAEQERYRLSKSLIDKNATGFVDIDPIFWTLLQKQTMAQDDTMGCLLESISDLLGRRGFLMQSLRMSSDYEQVRRYSFDDIKSERSRSAHILYSLGLLEYFEKEMEMDLSIILDNVDEPRNWPVRFSFFKISRLGMQFLQSCDMEIKADLERHLGDEDFHFERILLEKPVSADGA